MEFICKRTSTYTRNPRPCDEAYPCPADEDFWCVKIDTLEELMNFVRRNEGHVVIESDSSSSKWPRPKGMPYLEIYDDYRE